MGNGRKGMKGGRGTKRREALGIMRRGQLLPETYATRWAVDDAAGPGDKIVKVELRVIRVLDTIMPLNNPEIRK